MIRRAALACVVALAALFAPRARGDTPPSVWDRVRDPAEARSYETHLRVQERLASADGPTAPGILRGIRDDLERNGAATSKSALLRFDLGAVYEALDEHARAAEIYKAALAEFPDHPAVDRAWLRLAFACGHIGDNPCERKAYLELLRIETEEAGRATPVLNLAETQMHLGDLREAIEGYREALRLAGRVPGRETAPLATWGLAVALDRSGDRIGAEREARFAYEIQLSMGSPNLLHSKGVFFYPDYEVAWYDGLGAAARARVAPTPRVAAELWRQAERHFDHYVKKGEAKKDRWLPIAQARLSQAKAEREKAEKAPAAKPSGPPRPPPFDTDVKL